MSWVGAAAVADTENFAVSRGLKGTSKRRATTHNGNISHNTEHTQVHLRRTSHMTTDIRRTRVSPLPISMKTAGALPVGGCTDPCPHADPVADRSSAQTKGAGLLIRFSFLEHTGCPCHKVSCCAYSSASPGAPCQQARASGADKKKRQLARCEEECPSRGHVYVVLGTARDRCRDRIRLCRDCQGPR